jgi:hypothetical protein
VVEDVVVADDAGLGCGGDVDVVSGLDPEDVVLDEGGVGGAGCADVDGVADELVDGVVEDGEVEAAALVVGAAEVDAGLGVGVDQVVVDGGDVVVADGVVLAGGAVEGEAVVEVVVDAVSVDGSRAAVEVDADVVVEDDVVARGGVGDLDAVCAGGGLTPDGVPGDDAVAVVVDSDRGVVVGEVVLDERPVGVDAVRAAVDGFR